MNNRQIDLGRRQDDETAVDFIRVEIERVAEFLGNLRRETRAVDVEGLELRRLQPKRFQRLVVALDQMLFLDRQQPAIDQFVVAQKVHGSPSPPP